MRCTHPKRRQGDRTMSSSPYLTTSEAAAYLRYRSASGVRSAVSRGELRSAGLKLCRNGRKK
jgi:hypothetical protein